MMAYRLIYFRLINFIKDPSGFWKPDSSLNQSVFLKK